MFEFWDILGSRIVGLTLSLSMGRISREPLDYFFPTQMIFWHLSFGAFRQRWMCLKKSGALFQYKLALNKYVFSHTHTFWVVSIIFVDLKQTWIIWSLGCFKTSKHHFERNMLLVQKSCSAKIGSGCVLPDCSLHHPPLKQVELAGMKVTELKQRAFIYGCTDDTFLWLNNWCSVGWMTDVDSL